MTKIFIKSVTLAAFVALGGAANAATLVDDMATDGAGEYRSFGSFSVDYIASKAGSAALAFQLFGAKSVDGFGNGWDDLYSVALNNVIIFAGYFNFGGGGSDLITVSDNLTASTPVSYGGWQGGWVDVAGKVNLLKGTNTFTFTFDPIGANNGGGQSVGDESWAINAATITPATVPLPAAMPMMAVALGGLGAFGLRRRKA